MTDLAGGKAAAAARLGSRRRTDGATLYWTEAYGDSSPGITQPTVDLWGAPFTTDPATLDATAKEIASLPSGGNAYGSNGVAFGGYYAIITGVGHATVVRASDGAQQQVASGSGRVFSEIVYVSDKELWALMRDPNINAPGAEMFQRQPLAPWP